jgi:hypothetical protein
MPFLRLEELPNKQPFAAAGRPNFNSCRKANSYQSVLDPLRADLFHLGGGRVTMEFVRNVKREITGFLFSTTRVLQMTFTRERPRRDTVGGMDSL